MNIIQTFSVENIQFIQTDVFLKTKNYEFSWLPQMNGIVLRL